MRLPTIALALIVLFPLVAHAGVVSVPAPECAPVLEPDAEDTQYLRIRAPHYSLTGSPGDPELPFKDLHILLPPNADPASVSVVLKGGSTSVLDIERELPPSPPMVTSVDGTEAQDWGENKKVENGRNVLVYAADAFYPRSHVEPAGLGDMRKWRIARVRYYPYLYNPIAHRLELSSGGEIEVSFVPLRAVQSETTTRDDVLSDAVSQLVSNYPEARSWYSASGTSVLTTAQPQAATNYLILTTSAIVSGSPKLQAFVNHKTARGFGVMIATESQWGGGTGDAAANKIRAYLKANYVSKGFKYVLLIGDPNTATGTVPMKMLWPRRSSSTYREAPSDYFYADLTGNWDLDGDGYYGEGDNDLGPGGCDRYPEVIVGRIPFYGSFADLDSILQKIIDYESGVIGGTWVRRAVLSMKPSDAATPGYHLGEAIKKDTLEPTGFGSIRVYEQTYGINPPPDYVPCTYTTTQSALQQHAGFFFWWTHGNETLAADVITSDRTQYLDNNYPFFTFQTSCLNATPENPNNLAYALLKRGAIATNAATRVSWYYPGQVIFTNSDSNSGMNYKYAQKLIRDHLPCGDAHYQMNYELPNDIWMNHVVFHIYGDPSVAYAAGPTVTHTPHPDTDITAAPYTIEAQVVANAPLKQGYPVIKWNVDGGSSFNTAQMSQVNATIYRGQISGQPYGTTVRYYIHAEDTASRNGVSPAGAPDTLHSFSVRPDFEPPTIEHTALSNTGDTAGPYAVRTSVTDNTGVSGATLVYHRNTAGDTSIPMLALGSALYEGEIPGPSTAGDVISYYILATDASLNRNTARSPTSGYYSFAIPPKRRIAILNSTSLPPCFMGSNSNAYQQVADIMNADPAQRFQVNVVIGLSASVLANQDALVLPDNGVLSADTQNVVNWFTQAKTIVTMESATSYAACSGFLWPAAAGTNGYGTYWDTNASVNDQEIVLRDPITSGYSVGQVIESRGYTASLIASALPSDAKVLARSKYDPARAYAVYRDVPGKGRIVVLGPYIQPLQSQYSMIREALAVSPSEKSIALTAPSAGASYEIGDAVKIAYRTAGAWSPSDRIKLEYNTGLEPTWRQIAGAQSLTVGTGSYDWNTAGLPGSSSYKVRASQVAGSASGVSAAFIIAPVTDIAGAKSVPDGAVLKLKNKIVTADASGYGYLQEPNRMAGIKVLWNQALPVSAQATVVGRMSTVNGERAVETLSSRTIGVGSLVNPFLLNTSALGGSAFGAQEAVVEYRRVRSGSTWSIVLVPARGLNNVGLLVKVAGKVTASGTGYFYMDDGANCNDGSGMTGVRVLCGNLTKPSVGARVAVVGVSSTYFDRGALWRAILVTSQSELQPL